MERFAKVIFIAGLVIYFVCAVVSRIPAQWVAKAAMDSVAGLSLGGISGTLWKGNASSATIIVQGQTIDLGGLSWDYDGIDLSVLGGCADVAGGLFEGHVCAGMSDVVAIEGFILNPIPAKQLNSIIGIAQLDGSIEAIVRQATFTKSGYISDIDGSLMWNNARGNAAGGGWFELGGFNADISPNKQGGVIAAIADTSGEFEVQLLGEYTQNVAPTLNGTIKPRENANIQLVDSLGLVTEALDDGSFRITWPM